MKAERAGLPVAAAVAALLILSPLGCGGNSAGSAGARTDVAEWTIPGLSVPDGARADVAEWTILGLSVPDYAQKGHLEIPVEERQWIRHHKLEVRWAKAQPERGSFDWGYYDEQIAAILADGSQSLLLLLGGPVPKWARDKAQGKFAERAAPADLADWYGFCREVAARYGGVADFYEIWNEPGWDRDAEAYTLFGNCFFGGQVEKDYLPLLQVARKALKEADPSGLVICGALIDTLKDDPATGTGLYTRLFGADAPPVSGVTAGVEADRPILAERFAGAGEEGGGGGERQQAGAISPLESWTLQAPEGAAGDRVRLYNPWAAQARVRVSLAVDGIEIAQAQLELPAEAREVLQINELCGYGASCDMIAVHPYKTPGNWGPHYAALVEAMRAIGVDKELVVTEVGWPHYNDDDPGIFDQNQQADAIGEWGMGPLREAGCRKIWIYRDVDELPGKSWDKNYYGMFAHDGTPFPAWEAYKAWQAQNPSYPPLPASL